MAERFAEFLPRAFAVGTDDAQIERLAKAEVQWIYENNPPNEFGLYNVAHNVIYNVYRKGMRQAGLIRGHYYNDFQEAWILHFTADKERERQAREANEARLGAALDGNRYGIRDHLRFVNLALQLLDSSTKLDVLMGMLILTGRRESEIALTAKFQPYADNESHVWFTGAVKKRPSTDENGLIVEEVRPIPILCERELVCDTLLRIRQQFGWGHYTPKSFNAGQCTTLNDKVRAMVRPLLADCPHKITAHTLRSIYAAIAYFLLPEPQKYDEKRYKSKIMFHSIDDKRTVDAYQWYYVID